jgi:hypothetical protein
VVPKTSLNTIRSQSRAVRAMAIRPNAPTKQTEMAVLAEVSYNSLYFFKLCSLPLIMIDSLLDRRELFLGEGCSQLFESPSVGSLQMNGQPLWALACLWQS